MKKLGFILCVAFAPLLALGVTLDPILGTDTGYRTKINSNDAALNAGKEERFAAATELTIASGAITVTARYHDIDTESDAASDDLDTISGGVMGTSDTIIIRPESDARTVVVKHGTGNIVLKGGTDVTLDDIEDHIELFWDGTQWVDIGGGSGSSGSGDLLADGTIPLTANWDVGAYSITALTFTSDQATGTAPFTVASTTVVTNLNADTVDGIEGSAFLQNLVEDTSPVLGAALDLGGFDMTGGGVLTLVEQAAAEADVAGRGQLWVKTASPNQLWFTNDAGTDIQLGTGSGDLLADGTVPLTANWDVGAYDITAEQFHSDIATGTAPFTVASTTVVANLNADTVDGVEASAFLLEDGTNPLTANWDVGAYTITANGFTLGANENLTMGAETIDHDGTDFVFSDTISVTDVSVSGDVSAANAFFVEKAAQATPVAGSLEIWAKNDTPNILKYTNDAGTDFTVATLSDTLDNFAATTSAEFASIISDETGTGAVVLAVSPALTSNPTAPTQTAGDNDTSIATTAFVQAARSKSYAVADLSDTSTPSVLTTEETTGGIFSNYKASGADHVFTMPAAHINGQVIFSIGDEFQVDIEPNSSDLFYLNGTAMAADEHIQNTADTLGERIVGYCVNINGTLRWMFYSSDAAWVEATP